MSNNYANAIDVAINGVLKSLPEGYWIEIYMCQGRCQIKVVDPYGTNIKESSEKDFSLDELVSSL